MLFAIGLLFASPAHAASISLDYHLSASGFGPFAPVDPVTFTFHLAVDDAVAVTDQTDGLTVTDSNIALPSTMAFRYSPAGTGGFAIMAFRPAPISCKGRTTSSRHSSLTLTSPSGV